MAGWSDGNLLQHGLTAVFGVLIVGAFVYEAAEIAETFGWVAYPLVFGIGCVCFLLSRAISQVVASELEADRKRSELTVPRED